MAEAGYPNVEMSTWYGLFVARGTPRPIVEKLHAELKRVLALPEVQDRLHGLGGETIALTLEQFEEMNRSEFERFGKLIRAAKITLE
jgi:tripartite-type tricarboxylate transporter receptor subunit TctC